MAEIKCPVCKNPSPSVMWDNNTKKQENIAPDAVFISSDADTKDHDEVESFFHCPICGNEVEGKKLIKDS